MRLLVEGLVQRLEPLLLCRSGAVGQQATFADLVRIEPPAELAAQVMLSDELREHGLERRVALAKRPDIFAACIQAQLFVDADSVEVGPPRLCHIAVHHRSGDQAGVDHRQQVLGFQAVVQWDNPDAGQAPTL
ncbi:hypothetical protein FQZ97_854440 [compost metagenome]